MNQGNPEVFATDDRVYQDGGLFIQIPSQRKWWAIFAMFQSQSLTTDDKTGHSILPSFSTLPGADYPKVAGTESPNRSESRKIPSVGAQPVPLRIFISYRREDGAHVRLIHDRILADVPLSQSIVFWDLAALKLGGKYRSEIQHAIESCHVLIALIGRAWTAQISSLRMPHDFVRFELGLALKRGVPIIPVAFDGSPMPVKPELPPKLVGLCEFHGLVVPDDYFDEGIKRLLDRLRNFGEKCDQV